LIFLFIIVSPVVVAAVPRKREITRLKKKSIIKSSF